MSNHSSDATQANHVLCPACGALNRVPTSRPAAQAKCGRCHGPLFTGHPIDVDEARFRAHLQRDDLPLLVDMWAVWCGPCRIMAPQFERAATLLEPRVRLLKLNVDEARSVSAQYGVRSIPTLFLFHHGRVVDQIAGAQNADAIVQWTRSHLA